MTHQDPHILAEVAKLIADVFSHTAATYTAAERMIELTNLVVRGEEVNHKGDIRNENYKKLILEVDKHATKSQEAQKEVAKHTKCNAALIALALTSSIYARRYAETATFAAHRIGWYYEKQYWDGWLTWAAGGQRDVFKKQLEYRLANPPAPLPSLLSPGALNSYKNRLIVHEANLKIFNDETKAIVASYTALPIQGNRKSCMIAGILRKLEDERDKYIQNYLVEQDVS